MKKSKEQRAPTGKPASEELVFVSRNFTEFGKFTPEEVIAFYKRDIFTTDDFVRLSTSEVWIPLHDWLSGASSPDGIQG